LSGRDSGDLCRIGGTQFTIQMTMWCGVLTIFKQLDNISAGKMIGCEVLAGLRLSPSVRCG
jgi:hypothetical protein